MEMFLNLIYFTDPYFIKILTCLFWFFFNAHFFTHNLTKLSWIFKIFLCIVSDTSMTWNLRTSNSSPTQNISEGARGIFILMDSCNYLYSFQKLVAASFSSVSTATSWIGKIWSSPQHKVHFMRFFAQKHLLFKSGQLLWTTKLKSIFM